MQGRDFVFQATSPIVGVNCSPTVGAVLAKNNIDSIIDFLAPFGDRLQQLTAQDYQGANVKVFPLFLRFKSNEALSGLSTAQISSIITRIIPAYSSDEYRFPSLKNKSEVEAYRGGSSFESLAPWQNHYRSLISKQIGISEHEAFNQPVVHMNILTNADKDPINLLKAMCDPSALPEVYRKGYLDPNVPRLCLLLLDADNGPHYDVATFNQLKGICPCYSLHVNSVSFAPNLKAVVPDIWAPYILESDLISETPKYTFEPKMNIQSPNRCCRMSKSDIAGFDKFMNEFLAPFVFHHITTMIQDWERDVFSNRRGLSNRLFKVGLKYFGSSKAVPQESPTFYDNNAKLTYFKYNSPEMIMRRLADYSFMIRDFKYAQSAYESVRKDFSTNPHFARYLAGVQEMLAITTLMIQFLPNYETLHDAALASYREAKLSSYADRSIILVVEILKETKSYRESAFVMIKASQDDVDLRSALFLEQAAILFLRNYPSLPRRYAFHLFLSALRFSKSGLRLHSERNYQTAFSIYNELGWSLISDHINFSVGKQFLLKEEYLIAAKYYIKLLHKSQQSPNVHRTYLGEFMHIYQKVAESSPEKVQELLDELAIPVLHDSTIAAVYEAANNGGSTFGKNSEVWETMEKDILSYTAAQVSSGGKVYQNTELEHNPGSVQCAVGEYTTISFTWENPMHVPLPITNLALDCQFNGQPITSVRTSIGSDNQNWVEYEHFKAEFLPSIALDAAESKTIKLRMYPNAEGRINVIGINYLLCGVIVSSRKFARQYRGKELAVSLNICRPMPVLDVVFHNFPQNMVCGQVMQATLELENKGGMDMEGLLYSGSHSSFFYFGDPSQEQQAAYAKCNVDGGDYVQDLVIENSIIKGAVYRVKLPEKEASNSKYGVLKASQTTLIPIWIRPERPGKHEIRFLFVYQSIVKLLLTKEPKSKRYRTFRVFKDMDVKRSVEIVVNPIPSLLSPEEFMLSVDITNYSSTELVFKQLSATGKNWSISRNGTCNVIGQTLLPNRTSSIYLIVKRNQNNATSIITTPEFRTTLNLERLFLSEDPKPLPADSIKMLSTSLFKGNEVMSCTEGVFRQLQLMARSSTRLSQLAKQYPAFTLEQLSELFCLYWSDDLDIVCFFENARDGIYGHVSYMNLNLSLEPPLPIAEWFSGLDAKALAGRALFERTFRERKQQINSLLKSKSTINSPVRVLFQCPLEAFLNPDGICTVEVLVKIGNTSWMHEVEYDFITAAIAEFEGEASEYPGFSWTGVGRKFGKLGPLGSVEFVLSATFYSQGVFNLGTWKLLSKLSFPVEVAEGSNAGKINRVGKSFVQMPTTKQLLTIL